MSKKTVVLGVSGGIAVYKACDLARKLTRAGHKVNVIMTKEATKFVAPLTFAALTNNKVLVDLFAEEGGDISHIQVVQNADVFCIVPATANIVAKMACGIADDILSTCLLANVAPVLIAVATNTAMLQNPATQHNMETLKKRGAQFIVGECGVLACGANGEGRLAKTEDIFAKIQQMLGSISKKEEPMQMALDMAMPTAGKSLAKVEKSVGSATVYNQNYGAASYGKTVRFTQTQIDDQIEAYKKQISALQELQATSIAGLLDGKKDFSEKTILVTCGGTSEPIDSVRVITNHSSGKMGMALVKALLMRGAKVILIAGHISVDIPESENIEVVSATTTQAMFEATQSNLQKVDGCMMAAAPSDYKVQNQTD
ncbi:MAG: hypothetical protein FWD76_06500, partial [Firmicutes bacterium]|nr:hypothetical protein [Bacillota bacterium]